MTYIFYCHPDNEEAVKQIVEICKQSHVEVVEVVTDNSLAPKDDDGKPVFYVMQNIYLGELTSDYIPTP